MNKQSALTIAAIVIGISLSASRTPKAIVEAPSAETTNTVEQTPEPQAPSGVVKLDREADGHFYVDAMVNGTNVHFMVDTGASSVALTQADAQRAGMYFSANDFNQMGRGAGGAIALRAVKLDRVAVGPIEARDVQGVVIGGDGDISLLGQSFLATLGGVSIDGDTMTLRPA